eukprot:3398162-Pyramimonas_sp.AAC.1
MGQCRIKLDPTPHPPGLQQRPPRHRRQPKVKSISILHRPNPALRKTATPALPPAQCRMYDVGCRIKLDPAPFRL